MREELVLDKLVWSRLPDNAKLDAVPLGTDIDRDQALENEDQVGRPTQSRTALMSQAKEQRNILKLVILANDQDSALSSWLGRYTRSMSFKSEMGVCHI